MAVVPFPTTVPKSCSSATCPQTLSPAGQRGSRGPEWIKYSGRARDSRPSSLPEWGAVAGLRAPLCGVGVAGKEAGGGVLLGHSMAGKPLESRSGDHRHPAKSETSPWPPGPGFWNSLCSPPRRSPILTVSLGCGIQPAWRGAGPTAVPLSPLSGWVLPRGRSCSRGPLWGRPVKNCVCSGPLGHQAKPGGEGPSWSPGRAC